jgi:Ni,Fe-hydrogenase III small subunit
LRRTYDATPAPKLVVAVGDCGCDGGIFGESYASCGRVANVIPVDVAVPGCPPPPLEILRGILTAVRRCRPVSTSSSGDVAAKGQNDRGVPRNCLVAVLLYTVF